MGIQIFGFEIYVLEAICISPVCCVTALLFPVHEIGMLVTEEQSFCCLKAFWTHLFDSQAEMENF